MLSTSMYLLNDIMINFRRMNYKIPSLIQYLEKETGYSKGKGEKSSSFISLFEDVEEKDVEKYTKSHEEEGPRLILFLKGKDQLEMTVIATDNCRIYCQTENVINSIMILLASYYIFNLDYSRKYSQCLSFLQQYVLVDAFTSEKSLKYQHFVKKIANDLVEQTNFGLWYSPFDLYKSSEKNS